MLSGHVCEGNRRLLFHHGGALSEWGSHIIDQVLQLVPSKPEIVWGDTRNVVWSEHVDTYFKGLIRFENWLLAEIEVAYVAQYALPCWFVLGDEGTLVKEKKSSFCRS